MLSDVLMADTDPTCNCCVRDRAAQCYIAAVCFLGPGSPGLQRAANPALVALHENPHAAGPFLLGQREVAPVQLLQAIEAAKHRYKEMQSLLQQQCGAA